MKPELLAPAGNWPSLRAAVAAGADAVYFGVKELNMRAKAGNFETKEIKKVADFCHKNNIKAYLTLNTIVYEDEIRIVKNILNKAKGNIDAVICWDFSIIKEANKKSIPIHLSTQASMSNSESISFMRQFNIKRVNLARECSLEQIKKIIKKTDIEIETFIHGAMCISVSGRCLLSQEIFRKSANRGECLQPCRRSYITDIEEKHKMLTGSHYILSPKDICALPFIKTLMKSNISAFKIEGRNRSPEYVKIVTEVYREAIDNPDADIKKLMEKLKTVYNRGFSSGFYLNKPSTEAFTDAYGSKATKRKIYAGKIINYFKKQGVAEVKLESKDVKINDVILIIGNTTGVIEQKITSIKIDDKEKRSAKKGEKITIKTDSLVRNNDKLFLIKENKPIDKI